MLSSKKQDVAKKSRMFLFFDNKASAFTGVKNTSPANRTSVSFTSAMFAYYVVSVDLILGCAKVLDRWHSLPTVQGCISLRQATNTFSN